MGIPGWQMSGILYLMVFKPKQDCAILGTTDTTAEKVASFHTTNLSQIQVVHVIYGRNYSAPV